LAALLAGRTPAPATLTNACYSLVAPDSGISASGTYRPEGEEFAVVGGAADPGAADSPHGTRTSNAGQAESEFRTLTAEVFD
jgi:sulfide dehydrogenase [flavocytochrome c] flavoprotein subunit